VTTAAPDIPLDEEIRAARQAAGLTQEQLADLAGVSVFTVRSWEQGTRVPANSFALRIVRGVLAGLNNDERRPPTSAAVQEPGRLSRREAG
jgi:DNA-binding transcriptional regulator YiaG